MNDPNMLLNRNNRLWRKLGVPAAPYFELTPRCTLDCKMCYVHLTPEQMGDRKELSTEQWLRLTDEAVEAGMLYVVLTGGECMLHPGFWEIYYHLLDLGVVVSVNTNAWALTEEDLRRFRERCPAAVRVSIYGASEEGYERCTGRRAFGRVIENVAKLRDVGCRMGLAITLNRYNAAEFPDMIRVCRELKLPYGYIFDLTEPNEDTGRRLEDFNLPWEEILARQQEAFRLEGRKLWQNEPIRELPALLPDDPACKGVRCGSGVCSYVLHWDGRMSPCFEFRHDVQVLDVGFQAAWEATKQAAAAMPQPVECEGCRLRPICFSCVFSRRDPKNPGHCNPRRCEMTVRRYNAGLVRLPGTNGEADADAPIERSEC